MAGLTLSRAKLAAQFEPPADYGFFGPDSITWKVWSHPTSYILAFVRAVTVEHLDPNLAAAVIQSGGVKYRPNTRYARTLRYFGMVAFGATEPTAKAADVLVKVHSKAIGNDPVTGGTYDANQPSSQLWIHVTAWHSLLYCYEKFGPGRLTEAEENQYWVECARAAELQTIDPDTVPRSREDVRQYFEDWRPRVAMSEGAQDMVDFILSIEVALPPETPRWQRIALKPVLHVLRRGVIASYPAYIRKMFDVRQNRLLDAVYTLLNRVGHRVFGLMPLGVQLMLMGRLAPAAIETVAPVLLEIPPLNPITMTPREAQATYGFERPSEAHAGLRGKQRDRVFGKGLAPSDEGLIESEGHFGELAAVNASMPA